MYDRRGAMHCEYIGTSLKPHERRSSTRTVLCHSPTHKLAGVQQNFRCKDENTFLFTDCDDCDRCRCSATRSGLTSSSSSPRRLRRRTSCPPDPISPLRDRCLSANNPSECRWHLPIYIQRVRYTFMYQFLPTEHDLHVHYRVALHRESLLPRPSELHHHEHGDDHGDLVSQCWHQDRPAEIIWRPVRGHRWFLLCFRTCDCRSEILQREVGPESMRIFHVYPDHQNYLVSSIIEVRVLVDLIGT